MKTSKYCPECKNELPISEFATQGYSKTTGEPYYRPRCKNCDNAIRRADREKFAVYQNRYRQGNRDKVNAQARAWRKLHPDYHAHEKIAYREYNSRSGRGRVLRPEWTKRIEAFGGCCAYCGQPFGNLEVDHFIPRYLGGANDISNFVPACRECNAKKSGRHPKDWLTPEHYDEVVKVLASLMT